MIKLSGILLLPLAILCIAVVTSNSIPGLLTPIENEEIQVNREEVQQVNSLAELGIQSHFYKLHYQIIMNKVTDLVFVDKLQSGLKIVNSGTGEDGVEKRYNFDTGELVIEIPKSGKLTYDIQLVIEHSPVNIFLDGDIPKVLCDPDTIKKGTFANVCLNIGEFKISDNIGLEQLTLSTYPSCGLIGCTPVSSSSQSKYDDSSKIMQWSYESDRINYDAHEVNWHVSVPDLDDIKPLIFKTQISAIYNKHIYVRDDPTFNKQVFFVDNGLRYIYNIETILNFR
jgi:hypothetical protein